MAQGEEPKLIIDTDWKAQAQAEKEKLAAQSKAAKPAPAAGAAAGAAAGGEQERLGFADLVSMLATQALTYMGAFPDPRTGKAVVALEYAKVYIDLLAVLEEKTKGNLTPEELSSITKALSGLRLEFVDLAKEIEKAVAEGRLSPQGGPGPKAGPMGGGGLTGGIVGGT